MARPACQCLPTASLGSTCAGARQVGLIRASFLAAPETRATRPKRSALQSLQRRLIWATRTTVESSSGVAGMLRAPKDEPHCPESTRLPRTVCRIRLCHLPYKKPHTTGTRHTNYNHIDARACACFGGCVLVRDCVRARARKCVCVCGPVCAVVRLRVHARCDAVVCGYESLRG